MSTNLPNELGAIHYTVLDAAQNQVVFVVVGCTCRCQYNACTREIDPAHKKQHYTLREAEQCSEQVRARVNLRVLKVTSHAEQKG